MRVVGQCSVGLGGVAWSDMMQEIPPTYNTGVQTTGHFHFHRADKDCGFLIPVPPLGRMTETVQIDDRADRWRWVCPNGHRSWEPTNHHFWCQACARRAELDGVFQQLMDKKTGRQYAREDVRLLSAGGPHDPELDRRGRA